MQLTDYQWSGNPRGMHNIAAYTPLNFDRYLRLNLGWLKLVTGGEEFANDCRWLIANRITPIIRIYRDHPGAAPMDNSLMGQWKTYRDAGALWFEFYNEPNLADVEWPAHPGFDVNPFDTANVIRPLCDHWLAFAEYIISIGGYPGFPALSDTTGVGGAIAWLDAMLGYLRDNQRERFNRIIANGLWASVHPYTLNHFYQEVPGQANVPRDPSAYNALESGWHFEYPADPIAQAADPGRNPLRNGDPNGLLSMGWAFNQRLADWFGAGPVPAIGTEGGIYPLPINEAQRTDQRYPAYDRPAHAQATVAMFKWISAQAPQWFFGLCLWKENEYYDNQLPAIELMEQIPQFGGDEVAAATAIPGNPYGTGPGPAHGDPTYHWVILAPGLDPQWFFNTAFAYYNQFRPTVLTAWDLADFLPFSTSLALTVIAPRDVVFSMREAILARWPYVVFDVIVAEGDLQSVADTLNARVLVNRRLG